MLRPVSRSVAPLRISPPAAPRSPYADREVRGNLGPVREYTAAAARGPRAAHGDVSLSVRVFPHGGSAVIARNEEGHFDAVVR